MIPVPASEENAPEGLLIGKDYARMMFATRHTEKVKAVRMECKRIAANGGLVILETRVEGELGGVAGDPRRLRRGGRLGDGGVVTRARVRAGDWQSKRERRRLCAERLLR